MILLCVGTYVHGFDDLVRACDDAVQDLRLEGVAQIGHSEVRPRAMRWERFFPEGELQRLMGRAALVVCHGGMGIVGEAMRLGRPILTVPRRGATSAQHPANDQHAFVHRLAHLFPINVCDDLRHLCPAIQKALAPEAPAPRYALGNDVPQILAGHLAEAFRRPERTPAAS